MRNKNSKHLPFLAVVTAAWVLFWLAGLPDYYQQYSDRAMLIFDMLILPPIWYLVFRSLKRSAPGRGVVVSLWWAFYITVPLLIYDLLYCGLYLGYGISFLWEYWYLSVYYVLPWMIFPPTGCWIESRRTLI